MIGDLIGEIFEGILEFIADSIERGWKRLPRWGKVIVLILLTAVVVWVFQLCRTLSMPAPDLTPVKPI